MTPQERKLWIGWMGARSDWWALRSEPVIEPAQEVVDAHIHLWDARPVPDPEGGSIELSRYLPDEFLRDAGCGHRIAQCVYVECGSDYYGDGPANMRPVGEAAFAVRQAERLAARDGAPALAAIVAHADLRDPGLGTVLDAHEEKAGGRLRGIRHMAARMEDPSARLLASTAPPGLLADPDFRRGVALLGARGLVFDTFQFHFQLTDLVALAREVPDTTIVVDHLGCPVGYAGAPPRKDPVFDEWARHIEDLAGLPNVCMKLGGLASIVTGYDGHLRDVPPSSSEFVAERGAYFRHAIDCFGPERCMFESNFPVDSTSIAYGVLWNAYKRMASEHDAPSRRALLAGTARRVYGI